MLKCHILIVIIVFSLKFDFKNHIYLHILLFKIFFIFSFKQYFKNGLDRSDNNSFLYLIRSCIKNRI